MKSMVNLISCILVMLMVILLATTGVYAAGHPTPTPECQQLANVARRMNTTNRQSVLDKDCLQNSHCTGINCIARFKTQDSILPSSWLLHPFCYAFELMSCEAPLQVLVRVIDKNIQSTNYTYYFNTSDIRPVDKFKAKIRNAVYVQLFLNVTFRFDPHKRSAVFGIMSAIGMKSSVFGNYQSFPNWGKEELVPISTITVAKCTAETNFTVSYNPCALVPKLPDIHPTKPSPDTLGNCTMNTINGCGPHQMCLPDPTKGKNAGNCICAFDAKYHKATKSCEVTDPTIPTTNPSTNTTVIPEAQASSGGNSKLGLYIGVGVIMAVLLLTVATVAVFYLRKRARYRGRTRVLMVDDGLDTALMSDEDDMPINL